MNNVALPTPSDLVQTSRYNRFEFSYRQDFGKIVLLRQEPETGEVVQQFPTDYYLERYAESERTFRQAQVTLSTENAETEAASSQAASPQAASTGEGARSGLASAPAAAPSAPALPNGGPGAVRVDISV